MTSHHDVAVKLREQVKDDHVRGCMGRQYSCDCGYDLRTEGLLEQAADLLEAQAKALSEAETAYDGLMKAKETFRAEAHRNAARALAAEANLAEAMKVIKPIVSRLEWDGHMQRWTLKPDMPAGSITAARAFTNAVKTQESKDA